MNNILHVLTHRAVFLYRFFTQSFRFRRWRRRWVNTQTLFLTLIAAAFVVCLVWATPDSASGSALPGKPAGSPRQAALQQATPEPSQPPENEATEAVYVPPTSTPLPAEYLSNSNQTIGITLSATVLVVVVVAGVLLFMPRRGEDR